MTDLDLTTATPPELFGHLRAVVDEAAMRDHDRSMREAKLGDRIAELEAQRDELQASSNANDDLVLTLNNLLSEATGRPAPTLAEVAGRPAQVVADAYRTEVERDRLRARVAELEAKPKVWRHHPAARPEHDCLAMDCPGDDEDKAWALCESFARRMANWEANYREALKDYDEYTHEVFEAVHGHRMAAALLGAARQNLLANVRSLRERADELEAVRDAYRATHGVGRVRAAELIAEKVADKTAADRRVADLEGLLAAYRKDPALTDLIHALHTALHGKPSPARVQPPQVVWQELLGEVEQLRKRVGELMDGWRRTESERATLARLATGQGDRTQRIADLEAEVLARDSRAIDQAQRILRLEGDLVALRHARERIERATVLEGVLSGLADAVRPWLPDAPPWSSHGEQIAAEDRLQVAVNAARALLGETPDGPRVVLVDPDYLALLVGTIHDWVPEGLRDASTELGAVMALVEAVLGTVPGRPVQIVATGGERL